MIIPGFLISLLTFPGVIVHELAHLIFCRLLKIPVFEVKYFQLSNPTGYVLHEATDNPGKVFLISMGPFLVNTILGALIVTPVAIPLIKFNSYSNPLYVVVAWIGISILMHAFPSKGDAKVMVNSIMKNPSVGTLTKILVAPFIGLVYIGAIGSIVWLDLIYAIAIAMLIPNLLV